MKRLILSFCCLTSLSLVIPAGAYAQPSNLTSASQSEAYDKKAGPKEKLDYSYKILLDSYNKYLDNVFKTIGFLEAVS